MLMSLRKITSDCCGKSGVYSEESCGACMMGPGRLRLRSELIIAVVGCCNPEV